MPKGPKGEKRPRDVIGNVVHVMRIATGEIEESKEPPRGHAGGKKAGATMAVEARAANALEFIAHYLD